MCKPKYRKIRCSENQFEWQSKYGMLSTATLYCQPKYYTSPKKNGMAAEILVLSRINLNNSKKTRCRQNMKRQRVGKDRVEQNTGHSQKVSMTKVLHIDKHWECAICRDSPQYHNCILMLNLDCSGNDCCFLYAFDMSMCSEFIFFQKFKMFCKFDPKQFKISLIGILILYVIGNKKSHL